MTLDPKALEAATHAIMGGGPYADVAEAAITAYLSALGSEPVEWKCRVRVNGEWSDWTLHADDPNGWDWGEMYPGCDAMEAAPLYAAPQPVPEGWKLVPVEPDKAMVGAGIEARNKPGSGASVSVIYRAMLAAAPEAPHE